MDLNACSHSPVLGVHFELCAVQWRACCALLSLSVIFIAFLHWGKENVNLQTNQKASIRISKMVATSGKPNAWYVNKELACLWQTRVFLIFEPTWNTRSTHPLFRPEFGNAFCRGYVLFFLWSISGKCPLYLWWIYGNPNQETEEIVDVWLVIEWATHVFMYSESLKI